MGKGGSAENFYDVLNIRRDCSDKEIKAAYVELSKKFHPDVKSRRRNAQETDRFLKISEAYQTLIKPKLRNEYDRNLQATQSMRAYETSSSTRTEFHRPWEIKPDYNPNPGYYYGIKGLNRTTNSKIGLLFAVVGIFGGIFGFSLVRQSFSTKKQNLDDVSAKASEHHKRIRSEVENYSKDEQIRRVIDRISRRAD